MVKYQGAPPAILFVCLGNICRSPLAEGALRHFCQARGIEMTIDSAGTGDWHLGYPPDPRSVTEAARHGVDISTLRARQVAGRDFNSFDHIIAMDSQNLHDLQQLAPATATARLSRLLDHVDDMGGDVPDPYHGTANDFARTWFLVSAGVAGFVQTLGLDALRTGVLSG